MELSKEIEVMCPYCFTYEPKSSIIEHMKYEHQVHVSSYEDLESRFSALGGLHSRVIDENK